MMEISVLGSNYGEAIVIRFDSKKGRKYGLIDCYSWSERSGESVVVKYLMEDLKADRLAFVIVTHPHDDHVRGLHAVIEAYKGKIDWFGWWGGLYPQEQIAYFDWLEEAHAGSGENETIDSNQIKLMFDALRQKHPRLKEWHESVDGAPSPFYRSRDSKIPIEIYAVSPWLPEKNGFIQALAKRVDRNGNILDVDLNPNRASLGFLIKYGKARLILGGDVEVDNWDWAFAKLAKLFEDGAHFVKIPHHGSSTGRHEDMWAGKRRFFTTTPGSTVAVTTRFEKGRTTLPDPHVIKEIRGNCQAWVVAGKEAIGLLDKRIASTASICHLSKFKVKIKPSGHVTPHPSKHDICV